MSCAAEQQQKNPGKSRQLEVVHGQAALLVS
jgi:hypothetical protein